MKKETETGSKPYHQCLDCPHRGKRCDGPRTSSLTLRQWCELMRDMKAASGLTNAYIAERSGISITTVERLMALNADKDILRDTARRIEEVIVGQSSSNPCYRIFEEEHATGGEKLNDALLALERALADNKDYRDALDNIHDSYHREMGTIRMEAQKKIDFLVRQLDNLRADNERLWAENERKTRMIDRFVENKTGFVYQLVERKSE